jgi:hypothetical protein
MQKAKAAAPGLRYPTLAADLERLKLAQSSLQEGLASFSSAPVRN